MEMGTDVWNGNEIYGNGKNRKAEWEPLPLTSTCIMSVGRRRELQGRHVSRKS